MKKKYLVTLDSEALFQAKLALRDRIDRLTEDLHLLGNGDDFSVLKENVTRKIQAVNRAIEFIDDPDFIPEGR